MSDLRVHRAGVFGALSNNARLRLRLSRRHHGLRSGLSSELNHGAAHRREARRLIQIDLRGGAEFAQAIRIAEVIGLAFVIELTAAVAETAIPQTGSMRVFISLLFKLFRSGLIALRSELSIKPQKSPSAKPFSSHCFNVAASALR